jgi:hypothetical protein
MEFCITYPGESIYDQSTRMWTRTDKTYATGFDVDELFDLIQEAWDEGKEIEISIGEHDPTPQYLYDDWGGEAPVSMTEIHSNAHAQHIALHS